MYDFRQSRLLFLAFHYEKIYLLYFLFKHTETKITDHLELCS